MMPKFDRSKIAHVRERTYFAIVNGCQGLCDDLIFRNHEEALAEFERLSRAQYGADEQIVEVRVTIIPDTGEWDDAWQTFRKPRRGAHRRRPGEF